jgi:drug/metabolite transporter (DMT)-like permease
MTFLFVLAIFSFIGNLPFAIWEHMIGYQLTADVETGSAVLYASIFTTLLAYLAWNRGVDLVGAGRAGAFLNTIPLFGTTLAVIFLGEQPQLYHIVGFALILAGVTLAARPAAIAHQDAQLGSSVP